MPAYSEYLSLSAVYYLQNHLTVHIGNDTWSSSGPNFRCQQTELQSWIVHGLVKFWNAPGTKLFNFSWQRALVLTTLLHEMLCLSPTGGSLGAPCYCHILALQSSSVKRAWLCLLHICLLARAWCGPGPEASLMGPARQARCHQPWLSPQSHWGGGQAGMAEGSPVHVCCAVEASLRLSWGCDTGSAQRGNQGQKQPRDHWVTQ